MTEICRKADADEALIVQIVLQAAAKRLAEETGAAELNAAVMLADCAMTELAKHAPLTTPEYLRALALSFEDRACDVAVAYTKERRAASVDAVSAEIMQGKGAVH